MAGLLIVGALEGLDRLKKKRAGKRKSTATEAPPPPPSFSSTELNSPSQSPLDNVEEPLSAAEEKERLRLADLSEPTIYHDAPDTDADADVDAPPPYQAPPYSRHKSDVLLESSAHQKHSSSTRPRALFPARANTTAASVPESSAAAAEARRQGRKPCRVGPDGRCACGKRERSPGAPLGETVKERRERKWKEMWSFDNPTFWGLVGVSLASYGGFARGWDERTQFRYWRE